MKSFIAFIVIVAAGGVVGYVYWTSDVDQVTVYRSDVVARGDLTLAVNATGRIEPLEIVDVGAQVLGRIKSFGIDPANSEMTIDYGTKVKQGTLLATIDDALYQGALDQARADHKLSTSDKIRVLATLNRAKRDWGRAEQLKDTISQSEVDEAKTALEIAEAEVLVADAKIEKAKVAVDIAKINHGYTVIEAPIDGIVIDRLVDVGQTVVTGLDAPSLFLLARDLANMQIWAAVSESDIGQIRVGQKVLFTVDAYPETSMQGVVSQIRLNATTSHNVVTYGVIVDVKNPEGKLLPYMTASLRFHLDERTNAVLVPNQALRWRPTLDQIVPTARKKYAREYAVDYPVTPDTPTVWVEAEDGLVRPVKIEIGLANLVASEVIGGDLTPGDKVVIGTEQKASKNIVSAFMPKKKKNE